MANRIQILIVDPLNSFVFSALSIYLKYSLYAISLTLLDNLKMILPQYQKFHSIPIPRVCFSNSILIL